MSRVIAPPPPFKPYEKFTTGPSIFCRIFTADYNEFERLSLSHGKAQVFVVMLRHLNWSPGTSGRLFGVPCGYVYFVHN